VHSAQDCLREGKYEQLEQDPEHKELKAKRSCVKNKRNNGNTNIGHHIYTQVEIRF
jgi:hypothetical protein